MNIFNQPLLFKRISIVVSFVIVSLILWNTYTFFQRFKQEERIKMEILAEAQKELSTADLNSNIALPDKIITTNNSIPMILVDEEDEIIYANNLDSIKSLNPEYLRKQLAIMKKENDQDVPPPIPKEALTDKKLSTLETFGIKNWKPPSDAKLEMYEFFFIDKETITQLLAKQNCTG